MNAALGKSPFFDTIPIERNPYYKKYCILLNDLTKTFAQNCKQMAKCSDF